MGKLNCKIGDLAIVVNGYRTQNIGQLVEVLGPPTKVPFGLSGTGHVWQVRAVSGRPTLAYFFPADRKVVQHIEGPAPDCRLSPVPGLGLGDEVREVLGVGRSVPARRRKSRVALKVESEVIS